MGLVCLAAIPGIIVQIWSFGFGTLFQLCLSCTSAVILETLVLKLRKIRTSSILGDNSALLTGLLLAVSIPPLSPWWMVIVGNAFSIVIAKQIYGGLGCNPFNPAMVGYVVLLISFPLHMTNWLIPCKIITLGSNFIDILQIIFTDCLYKNSKISCLQLDIDGISQATPLDACKMLTHHRYGMNKILLYSTYRKIVSISCWKWINIAYLIGGLFLIQKRVINWSIPISFLSTLVLFSYLGFTFFPKVQILPQIHLFSGATMLGAFFILTDPVTTSLTNRGRLIFGILSGILVWLIRSFSIYPDGVAFSVLLANIFVPLIDFCTVPKSYGRS